MAKSLSPEAQTLSELLDLYKDTTVEVQHNVVRYLKASGNVTGIVIRPTSDRKSKRLIQKYNKAQEMVEQFIRQEEETAIKMEEKITDCCKMINDVQHAKSYVEEDLHDIFTQIVSVDAGKDSSSSVYESNERNVCRSHKSTNEMPRVIISRIGKKEEQAVKFEETKSPVKLSAKHTPKVIQPKRPNTGSTTRPLKDNKKNTTLEKVLAKPSCKIKSTKGENESYNSKDNDKCAETYKPFSCNKCEKSFQFKSALKAHKVSHTGVKRYKCDRCRSRFSQKSHLTRHLLTHKKNTAKRFKCSSCKMSFRQNDYLQVHMRVHSGVKPYTCDICKKSFSQKSHLNTHAKSHREKQLTCDMCSKKFTLLHHLSTHKQNVHNFLKGHD